MDRRAARRGPLGAQPQIEPSLVFPLVSPGGGLDRCAAPQQPAVRWAAEKKGTQPSEDELRFAKEKCFSSPVIIIVSMVGDENKFTDQENYAACWCAIENLLVAAAARGLGSYPSTG